MDVKLKIYVLNEQGEKFLGIGVFWLLSTIREVGSIRKAAAELGLSYTKALNMLRSLEMSIGCRVLDRRKGGDDREGALLTSAGVQVIELYDSFQKKVKQDSHAYFQEFHQELLQIMEEYHEKI